MLKGVRTITISRQKPKSGEIALRLLPGDASVPALVMPRRFPFFLKPQPERMLALPLFPETKTPRSQEKARVGCLLPNNRLLRLIH